MLDGDEVELNLALLCVDFLEEATDSRASSRVAVGFGGFLLIGVLGSGLGRHSLGMFSLGGLDSLFLELENTAKRLDNLKVASNNTDPSHTTRSHHPNLEQDLTNPVQSNMT